MPIHLPPISRRKFLIRSVVAGAGLALSRTVFAVDKKIDEDFWVLFSDTHIAADRAKIVRDVNMADHLATVSRELLALPERPAGVFVIGDCAWNSGEKDDYATFTNLLEPIRRAQMAVHLALGNHDNRERFWDALEEEKAAKRPLADRQAALLQTPRVNWFILDSLEKTLVTPGLIGADQLDWLARSLDANSNKPAVILVHHNLDSGEKSIGLRDTEELFKVLRPRKQAKACFT
jgi:3',5'-cyclic-AMP phosphodiesterase